MKDKKFERLIHALTKVEIVRGATLLLGLLLSCVLVSCDDMDPPNPYYNTSPSDASSSRAVTGHAPLREYSARFVPPPAKNPVVVQPPRRRETAVSLGGPNITPKYRQYKNGYKVVYVARELIVGTNTYLYRVEDTRGVWWYIDASAVTTLQGRGYHVVFTPSHWIHYKKSR